MKLSSFNELTKWSNLARLASGNVPKLTIVAPFIAFIIFHNKPLQPFLSLSNERHSSPIIEYLAQARFDIFYLGLVIVGAGVAVFTLFCPKQITGYRGYEEFITFKESTKTANGVAGSFRLTNREFLKDVRDLEELRDENGGSLKYPRRFREGFTSLICAVDRMTENQGGEISTGEIARERDAEVDVLKKLSEDNDETGSFRSRFYDGLEPFSIDVFRLEFLKADYSKPSVRAISFWIVAIGTAVILIPTLITTILVLSDLFSVSYAPVSDGDGL